MTSPAGTIDAEDSLWQAAVRLAGGRYRRLVVLDQGRPAGVIDEKVLTEHWPCAPFGARQRTVGRIVPGRAHTVMPHVSISRVAAIMQIEGVDAVPVVDGRGRVIGLVTGCELIGFLARGDSWTDDRIPRRPGPARPPNIELRQ